MVTLIIYILAALGHLTQIVSLEGSKKEWLESIICSILWPLHLVLFWLAVGFVALLSEYQEWKNAKS